MVFKCRLDQDIKEQEEQKEMAWRKKSSLIDKEGEVRQDIADLERQSQGRHH